MAKKLTVTFLEKASESLKKHKIEHVLVTYVDKDNNVNDAFLLVTNKDYHNASAVIKADGCDVLKVKNFRHYAKAASSHTYYQPLFECECRNCGKMFKHLVKEAAWCSTDCRKEFYNRRRETRKAD